MDRREAAEILGIEEHSSEKIIKDAHRKLIQKLHSDRGGTDYLASLINQARDILLDN
jgi:curved DNA-binding protein CbpA